MAFSPLSHPTTDIQPPQWCIPTPSTNHPNHKPCQPPVPKRPPTTTYYHQHHLWRGNGPNDAFLGLWYVFLIILFYFANTLNLTASHEPPAGTWPPWPITRPTRPLQPTMTHNTTYVTPATHHNPHHNPHNPHNPQPPPMQPLQPTKPHTWHMMPETGPDDIGHIIWALAILFGV